jgi:hypothetical protein
MPRYRLTRTERVTHEVDCANPEQALELAATLPEWAWRSDGDDATTYALVEVGPGESDAEAEREVLVALASMGVAVGGAR